MDTEQEITTSGQLDDGNPKQHKRYEFRLISSILEYRELNELIHRFGIITDSGMYDDWKPMSGRVMMTLPANELRAIADLIDQK